MARPRRDIVGQMIGKWLVEATRPKQRGRPRMCVCLCTGCGQRKLVKKNHLLAGETSSCGCQTIRDLTGLRVGRLKVLRRAKAKEYPHAGAAWECVCDCGKTLVVPSNRLTRPVRPKRSCGCTQQRNAQRERREPVVRCEAYLPGIYDHRRVAVGEVLDVKVGSFCSSWLRRVPSSTPVGVRSDEPAEVERPSLAAAPVPVSPGRSGSQSVLDAMREERLGGRVVRVWRNVPDDDTYGRAKLMDDVPWEEWIDG